MSYQHRCRWCSAKLTIDDASLSVSHPVPECAGFKAALAKAAPHTTTVVNSDKLPAFHAARAAELQKKRN